MSPQGIIQTGGWIHDTISVDLIGAVVGRVTTQDGQAWHQNVRILVEKALIIKTKPIMVFLCSLCWMVKCVNIEITIVLFDR